MDRFGTMKRTRGARSLRYLSDSERGSELDKPVSLFFPLCFHLLRRDEILALDSLE